MSIILNFTFIFNYFDKNWGFRYA